jgi:hypothetical protein
MHSMWKILLFVFVFNIGYSQSFRTLPPVNSVPILPNIYTKVAGWEYMRYVIIPLDSIARGIKLETSDSLYRIVAFQVIYTPKKGEKLERKMSGNSLNIENFDELKKAKPGDILRFEHVKAKNESMSLEIYGLQVYIKAEDE